MIHFVVPADQDFAFADYLALNAGALASRAAVLHYESIPDRPTLSAGTYVFSALDQLTPAMTALAAEVHDTLRAAGATVLNDPSRTLQRFELLMTLNQHGLNGFTAARANGDLRSLRYPVFLRGERLHAGSLSPLLHSVRDIETAIGRALVAGHRLRDLLLVEWVDAANDAGEYRQYSAFVVGNVIIARHVAVAREWMVKHSDMVYTPALAREHRDFVATNPHAEHLIGVARTAGVGYGRIDYAVIGGRVQVWEINLNPTIGPRPDEKRPAESPDVRAIRDEARAIFYDRFREALEGVAASASTLSPIALRIDPRIARAALAPRRRSAFQSLMSALDPARSILRPLVGAVARPLGMAARRGSGFGQ